MVTYKKGEIVMEDKLLLKLLQKNARMKITDLAAALDESKDDIIQRLIRTRESHLWLSYNCKLGSYKYRNCNSIDSN